jgi:hypothetical protein
MEWVDGVKLTDKAAMAAAGLNVVDFVDVGIECTLRQLLEHGYFHADPQCGFLETSTLFACNALIVIILLCLCCCAKSACHTGHVLLLGLCQPGRSWPAAQRLEVCDMWRDI